MIEIHANHHNASGATSEGAREFYLDSEDSIAPSLIVDLYKIQSFSLVSFAMVARAIDTP
jgi:hypothetical protein